MAPQNWKTRFFRGQVLGPGERIFAALLFCGLLSFTLLARSESPSAGTPAPFRIDLAKVGYDGLPAMARSSANLSLDFVDDNHVLFTYNPKQLVRRRPDCPLTHQDHLIRAVLLEVPSGKVVKQADWYLHDMDRYLWPLDSGRFLLRKLNSLFVVDSSLQEKLLLDSPREILWVSVTPDARQIILEREGQPDAHPEASLVPTEIAKAKATVEFLDAGSLAVQSVLGLKNVVRLEGTSLGYADVKQGRRDDVWLIRFGPSQGQRHNIARVRSRCTPNVFYASNNTLLIGRCSWSSPDYSLTAFAVTGLRLWRKQWEQNRYYPAQKRNEEGSRFALGTLKQSLTDNAAAAAVDNGPASDSLRGMEQEIQVFDTASGTPVFTTNATPVVVNGQNFSRSPDGRKLAVLRETTIEIDTLPAVAEDEKAKYAALEKDALGPRLPAAGSDSAEPSGEEIGLSALDNEDDEPEKKNALSESAVPATEAQREATSAHPPRPPFELVTSDPQTRPLQSAAQEKPSVTIRASAQVVALDVVVTDKKGRPVPGLRSEDFQVTEDGKPQRVSYFREFADTGPGTAPSESPASTPQPKLPPNVFTNQAAAPEDGPLMVILLDLLNTKPIDREHGRDALLKFLKKKGKGQQWAVFTLGTSLQMIQGFTLNETLLASIVSGKKGSIQPFTPWMDSNEALDRALGASEWVTSRMIAQLPTLAPEIIRTQIQMINQSRVDDKYRAIDSRVRFTIDAFAQLARYLAGVPGRKNLLWLSGSFPSGVFPNQESVGFDSAMRHTQNYSGLIRQATSLMAESHVAVYPIDVRGQSAPSMFTAEQTADYSPLAPPPYLSGSVGDNTSNMLGPATLLQQQRESSVAQPPVVFRAQAEEFHESQNGEHDTMEQLAADTGGKAFYRGNNIVAAIENAAAHGSHYYALSYTPANRNYNGKFRTIKVTLGQSGYRLSHRRGYFADDQNSAARELQRESRDSVAEIEAAAMQHGSPSSRQVFFVANVLPVGKQKRMTLPVSNASAKPEGRSMEVQHHSVDYAIDLSGLRLRSTPEGLQHGVLDFMIASFDDNGKMLTSNVFKASTDLTQDRYAELLNSGIRMHLETDIPAKAAFLRLGVADVLTNRIGTVEFPLPVKVLQASKAYLGQALPAIEPD